VVKLSKVKVELKRASIGKLGVGEQPARVDVAGPEEERSRCA
jgi:hypothetical protein